MGVRVTPLLMSEVELGPAMAALTEKQRAYVYAQLSDPFGNPTRWARAAGYSDHMERAKVTGHLLSHNPKIEAAVQELARSYGNTLGPLLGLSVVMRIAKDKSHPKHFAAGVALMDRFGLPAMTEQRVSVQHTDQTGAAMVERIRDLAQALGIDPAVLLGSNAPADVKLIEGKAEEVSREI